MKTFQIIFIGTLTAVTALLSAEPIRLHPDNPHYFLFRDKPIVLITSGEHYGAVMNLDFDFVPYFEELAEHGLNQTRLFSGAYVEQWGSPWNTLNPPGSRFICPWARSSEGGYIDGGNKFDLNTFDEAYFTRLRDFINEAGKHDVVVELVLFCVYYNDNEWNHSPLNSRNNINTIGTRGRHSPFNEDDQAMMEVQEKLVKKIAEELKDLDNVYYELCNEPYWDEGPAIGDGWNDRIIAAVREVDASHLIALNVANDYAKINNPTDHVSIFNFHYSQPNSVRDNYSLQTAFGDDETGFDGSGDSPYRKEAWDFILAGGAEYSNLDWSFTVESERGDAGNWDKNLGGGGQAIREQLGHLKAFIDGFGFVRMAPSIEFIRGGVPGGVQALAEEGQAYAVYLNGGGSASLQVELPAGNYTAEWLNTKTGNTDKTETFDHSGGTRTLTSPGYSEDIALSIKVDGYRAIPVPFAPDNLTAGSPADTSVTLEWADNSDNEDSFVIEYRLDGGDWMDLSTQPANTTSFTADGLAPETAYEFRVRAVNGDGESGWSNSVAVTTAATGLSRTGETGLFTFAVEGLGIVYTGGHSVSLIGIYDILGNRIHTYKPDSQVFTWDRKDAGGNRVPDGLYFFRIRGLEKIYTGRTMVTGK